MGFERVILGYYKKKNWNLKKKLKDRRRKTRKTGKKLEKNDSRGFELII